MSRRTLSLLLAGAVLVLVGCRGGTSSTGEPREVRGSLSSYLAQVEPIRDGVNQLLDGADPILAAYRECRIGAAVATRRMNALEHRFAAYAVQIASVRDVPTPLRAVQRAYAHTFVFEDAYLSTLVAAIPGRDFGRLPETQGRQRDAIIAWRIAVEALAARQDVKLPADLQAAGRGEIAPSPEGS
ncbi:MAG: hypothetical protein JST08_17425 [Actinobacteria bacterium]|nr:hypothetical protein [Actinomycetota bacterium]